MIKETAAWDFWLQLGCTPGCVCVILWRDADEGGGEGRLAVSDFINEEGNVFIPGLDTPTTFLTHSSCYVCWCAFETRRWLSPIPSSASLTGPSCRAASLFPPLTRQQPSWRPCSPANTTYAFDPQSAPLILMKGGRGVIKRSGSQRQWSGKRREEEKCVVRVVTRRQKVQVSYEMYNYITKAMAEQLKEQISCDIKDKQN